MKEYQINCCGKSPISSPALNVFAASEHEALTIFAKSAAHQTGHDEQHFYDNFEAIEL